MYQGFGKHHDLPVKNATVDLPIRLRGKTHFRYFVESVGGPRRRISALLRRCYKLSFGTVFKAVEGCSNS